MKIWNLTASQGADGSKVLDIQIHGTIDGGWLDDDSTSTAEIAKALAEHQDAKKIETHINSLGGSLFGGIALYNILQAHPAEVTSYVDGIAASAASIIAMAGKTVMGRGAMLMIHNPLNVAIGDAAELRRVAAVLDKARDGLLSVYKAKTGKNVTELKAMLDAETWLGGDQALRQGFADEIATDGAEAEVEAFGDQVMFNGAAFARAALPAQILAMAARRTPPAPVNQTPPTGAQRKENDMEITREVLTAKAPELLKALLAEGKSAGVEEGKKDGHATGITAGRTEGAAAERARLQAIDELEIKGCDDLVKAAKYGDKPSDAPTLAMSVLKAGKAAGAELLAARERESAAAAAVKQSTDKKTEDLEMEAAKNIAKHANERRGGSR